MNQPYAEDGLLGGNVSVHWDTQVPMRDGVRLRGILYLPQQPTPAPGIFLLTPYTAQSFHDAGLFFAAHGCPFLVVDMRGRGNSPGEFKLYHTERKDGYDIVEWLARQPFCDGHVAGWGMSYGGYTQWAAAAELPPHLATIVPIAAPFRGVDNPIRNNTIRLDRLAWSNHVAGRTSQIHMWAQEQVWAAQYRRFHESGRPFREVDTFLGIPSPIFQEWISHLQQGPYWDAFNPTPEEYARLSLPILTITGHYDVAQPGALEHYAQHMRYGTPQCTEMHHLVLGPWDHQGTSSPQREFGGIRIGAAGLVDLRRLHLEWCAWILQRGPKPDLLRARVAYYVLGAERWRYAENLEAITAHHKALYLTSDRNPTDVFTSGGLVEGPEQSGPDHYVYDPRDVSTAQLESTISPSDLCDQRILHARRGKLLVYHTEPFDDRVELSGFFRLSLWMAIDQPDTDFRVSVHEIGLDGSSLLLSSDTMRARFRQSLREQMLIDTGSPLRYDFKRFTFVSRQVARGSRLRLVIEPINSIYMLKNYNAGGVVTAESSHDARTVTVHVFHDESRPSVLQIPIGRPDG